MNEIESRADGCLARREFLHLAAAGAALLPAVSALAAETDKPEFTFALVSDNHLGRQGNASSERMKKAVDEVNASPAEFTLFCGDLVDQGEKDANEKRYGEWLEIARGLKKESRVVPGNHDPVARFRKHIQKETDTILDHRGYRFVCFADAQPNPGHDGVVTPEQLRWLKDRIEEAAKKGLRVVLMAHVIHHENKHPDTGWYIQEGRKEFGKLLQANAHVVAFFAGHFHCGVRGWDDTSGVHEVIVPSTSWNADRKLEKAPGFALKEFRPGYALVEVYADRLVLRYKPIGEKATEPRTLPLRKA